MNRKADLNHLVGRRVRAAVQWGIAMVLAVSIIWAFLQVGIHFFQHMARPGNQIRLRILFWGSPNEVNDVRTAVRNFEIGHPRIKVTPIPVSGSYYTKLDSMLAAGHPPDVMYVSASRVHLLEREHVLKNLNPLVRRWQASGKMQWFSDYFPKVIKAFTVKHKGRSGLYGLPKDFSTMTMYVNLRLFHQAGVKVPYAGWTWGQYEQDVGIISRLSSRRNGRIFGGMLITSSRVLRNIIWTFGGHFFDPQKPESLDLGSPQCMAAFHMIRTLRFTQRTLYNHIGVGFTQRGVRAFLAGRVGVLGPWGRWFVPQCRAEPNLRFDVVPLPHAPGVKPVALLSTVAWGLAAASRHPDAAFSLVKFLSGPPGQAITTREGLSVPSLQRLAQGPEFLAPGKQPANARLFLREAQIARLAPGLREDRSFNALLRNTIGQSISLHNIAPQLAVQRLVQRWRAMKDSPLRRGKFPSMPWPELISSGLVLTGLGALLLLLWGLRQKWCLEQAKGIAFIAPWLFGFIFLTLLPMLLSFFLSLTKWRPITEVSAARFVGLANYQQILFHDPHFVHSLVVTITYTLLILPIGQTVAIGAAVLLNRTMRGAAIFRFIILIPLAVSGVCLGTLWLTMFNDHHGLINELLRPVLGIFGARPPDWFGSSAHFWAVPAFVLMSLWTIGSAVIIYLAGLQRIPESLHEAARMDGAGAFRRFFAITLPILSPIIFFNLVVSLIGAMQLFSQAQVMTDGRPGDSSLFYVLYIFQQGFEYFHFGFAAALSWLLFVFILVLTLLIFRLARRWISYEGAWL